MSRAARFGLGVAVLAAAGIALAIALRKDGDGRIDRGGGVAERRTIDAPSRSRPPVAHDAEERPPDTVRGDAVAKTPESPPPAPRAGFLVGRLVDRDGRAAPSVKGTAWPMINILSSSDQVPRVRGETDEDGWFCFEWHAQESVDLVFEGGVAGQGMLQGPSVVLGSVADVGIGVAPEVLGPREEVPSLEWPRSMPDRVSGSIAGRVFDESGRPAPDVWVSFESLPTRFAKARSDDRGAFLVELEEGDWDVSVKHALGRSRWLIVRTGPNSAKLAPRTLIRVERGATADVSLSLADLGSIEARVVSRGASAAGVRVRCRGPMDEPDYVEVTTDAEGRADAGLVDPGRYRIDVGFPDEPWDRASAEVDVVAPERATITIWIPECVVEGVVRDAATGRPLPGAFVRVRPPPRGDPEAPWPDHVATRRIGGGEGALVTGADGRFRAESLPAGDCRVTAACPGRAQVTMTLIASPGAPAIVDLALSPEIAIEGRVVDAATGEGIGGAAVLGLDAAGAPNERAEVTVADESGRFRIGGLVPSGATLRVFREGYRPAVVRDAALSPPPLVVALVPRPSEIDAGLERLGDDR